MLLICFDFPRELSLLLWRICGSLWQSIDWRPFASSHLHCPLCRVSTNGFHPCHPPCCFCNKLIFHNFLWSTPTVVHVTLYLASKELWQFTCFQFKCFHWHYMLSLSSISKKTRWNYFLFMVQFTFHVLSKVGKTHVKFFAKIKLDPHVASEGIYNGSRPQLGRVFTGCWDPCHQQEQLEVNCDQWRKNLF